MTFVLQSVGLTKDYGQGRGVFDVTLCAHPGQVVGFLGPNGAGKSTFVKMMVGLIRPTAGQAFVLGEPVGDVRVRRHIGYLPELFRYQEWLTAEEVLRLHSRLLGLAASEQEQIGKVLTTVGLGKVAHERIRRFSKGMQQRLGIACALLGDPAVIFLDEPTSALDPIGRHDVTLVLERLADTGKTVFLNTHLLEDVESVCDEVALLWSGRIREQGAVGDILGQRLEWRMSVAGWTPDVGSRIVQKVGGAFTVESADEDGTAKLLLTLGDREALGFVHRELVAAGVTVYEVERVVLHLTQWFLSQAERADEAHHEKEADRAWSP